MTSPRESSASLFEDEPLPLGARLLEEGAVLGSRIKAGRSAFCEAHHVANESEWKRSRMASGQLEWSMIMGLSTLDEQVEGLRSLHEFGERTGVVIDRGLIIPNWVTGLPERLRERAPKGTSFVLGGVDEHVALAQAAPIMPCFNDWHIGSPAAVDNTIAAIQAGGNYMGVLAQYVWDLPYVESDVETVAENVRAIGIAAQKSDDGVVVDSYLDDGMPSQFADNASMVGYALLERYVVEELCGARYATGFGQLVSNIPTKIAIWLALGKVLSSQHPSLSYLYGNTLDASASAVTGNFGVSAAEITAFAVTERRYRTGIALLPNPATEALRVPTVDEIADVHAVARRAAAKATELEAMFDFSSIEQDRDELARQGQRFFANVLAGLPEFGVDVRDPVQLLLGMRRLGAARLETLFHPGARDATLPNGVVPYSRTEFTNRAALMVDDEIETVRARGGSYAVVGMTFIVGSSDTHSYGAFVLVSVLRALGARVIDAGVDRDPEDLAHEVQRHPGAAIAVSVHNGQSLEYAQRLVTMLAGADVAAIFMGGKLNAMLPGVSEPVEVAERLRAMGVVPCERVVDLVGFVERNMRGS